MEEFDIKNSPRMVLDAKTEREILRNNAGRYKTPRSRFQAFLWASAAVLLVLLLDCSALVLYFTGNEITGLPSITKTVIFCISIGVLMVASFFFTRWIRRAYSNLHALYVGELYDPDQPDWIDQTFFKEQLAQLDIYRMMTDLVKKSRGPGIQEKPSLALVTLWMVLLPFSLVWFVFMLTILPTSGENALLLIGCSLLLYAGELGITVLLMNRVTDLQESSYAMINS
jgi:hypothetical protein